MSSTAINDAAVVLDEIFYPLLTNPVNQEHWPAVVRKDVDLHLQELRNVIAEVRVLYVVHVELILYISLQSVGSIIIHIFSYFLL
jgi:dynein heavy chain, axonemal